MEHFDIIEYISGLTTYVFDESILNRIAIDRGVDSVSAYTDLTQKDKDLIKADLLYEVYLSPNIMASLSKSHGNFSLNIGSQQTNEAHRERLYNIFMSIYKKYQDPKLDEITDNGEITNGTLQWISGL